MLAIKNGKIILEKEIVEGKYLLIEDGKIFDISDSCPENCEVIDAKGNFVSPGFIDIHIHAAGGYDTMDENTESINEISKIIARHGVTSFLPTTMTVDEKEIKKALKNVKYSMDNGTDGALVLGAHLEGPFISEKKKGAHDEKYIREPDIDFFTNLVDGDFSVVKTVTIAPELNGALEFIKFIEDKGITASLGHSNGTYDDVIKAVESGATHSTHLYNAMTGFSHREPGVVGAIFDSPLTTEFIADGVHIHFAAIRTAIKNKGCEKCSLITDAMKACDLGDGEYDLGGLEVFVKNGEARLKDGTLAGSTLTLDRAVRNILKNTNLNIVDAVSMATKVPAKISRVADRKGTIKKGYDADIAIFDEDINVKTTIVGGKVVYK